MFASVGWDSLTKFSKALMVFTAVDVFYTTAGAFYGGGGAELNPLFNWLSGPAFIIIIIIAKIIAVSAVICLIERIASDPNDGVFWATVGGYLATGVYIVAFLSILAMNVMHYFDMI